MAVLVIADHDGSAVREHPETGARMTPADGFEIIATTNAERLVDLPANLLDRFPIRINIDEVNPDALAMLPEHLREVASMYANRTRDRYSLRSFFAYNDLTGKLSVEDAATLIFGDEAPPIVEAARVANALAETRDRPTPATGDYDSVVDLTEDGDDEDEDDDDE